MTDNKVQDVHVITIHGIRSDGYTQIPIINQDGKGRTVVVFDTHSNFIPMRYVFVTLQEAQLTKAMRSFCDEC